MLKDDVLKFIIKNKLIVNGDKIVAGVSGGPDSICMLNILNDIKSEKKIDFDIVVAHINHGIRKNSILDEEYVKQYCNDKKIKLFILKANVKEEARKQKRGLEETGRIVRYNFFNEILKNTNSNKIAIAHNSNDNVETVLMNILRGTGLNGLKGIEKSNDIYIRPLIEIQREDIENYCIEQNLNPRHDESNDDNTYTRNKIRNLVIPYIKKELNPNIIKTINRLSKIAKDDLNYLEKQTIEAYKKMCIEENISKENVYKNENEAKIILDLKKFNKENIAIQKRVILYAISRIFGSTVGIETIHIEDIVKLCNNNIGNKYLTPNKNTKIEIKNKKILINRIN